MNNIEEIIHSLLHYAEELNSEFVKFVRECLIHLVDLERDGGAPIGYAESVFTNHLIGKPGSEFLCNSTKELVHMLFMSYGNKWEEFTPPVDAIAPGCRYFRVTIPDAGFLGAIRTSELLKLIDPKSFVAVRNSHSGNFEIHIYREKFPTNTVTLITEKVGDKEVLSTIYPGEPTPRGDVEPASLKDAEPKIEEGDFIPLRAAAQLGFSTVKFVRE